VLSTRPRRSAPHPGPALKITIARTLLTRAYHLLADLQATGTTTPLQRP